MSVKIVRFSDVPWADLADAKESPMEFCLRADVPVYVKVRRVIHAVYYSYRILSAGYEFYEFHFMEHPVRVWKRGFLPLDSILAGFHDGLLYLRLDKTSLAELAPDPVTTVSTFSRGGYAIPRPRRSLVQGKNEQYDEINIFSLIKVDFLNAFLVDKKQWQSTQPQMVGRKFARPESFTASMVVDETDLYFIASDIEALKRDVPRQDLSIDYKFWERIRPGIQCMLEAARALNSAKSLSRDQVKAWLKSKNLNNPFRYKSVRTAEKFVGLKVDRAKGRKAREDFFVDDLALWTDPDDYKFEYISPGLTHILAIAEWWCREKERDESKTVFSLAEKLIDNKFAGLEVGDLVFLISGKRIQEQDAERFEGYLQEKGLVKDRIVERELTPAQLIKREYSEDFRQFAAQVHLTLPTSKSIKP